MRGGRRIGAGRKPKLTTIQRWAVGGRCEQLSREATKANEDAAIEAATRHVSRQWAKAHGIPVHKRKAWLTWGEFEDYLDDVRGGMQQDQGIDLVDDNSEPARVVTTTPKRPKGVRSGIIARVAGETGIAYGTVERCWKEFRAIEAELENDSD